MKVRKAIMPAAGMGTRFLPATKAQPKEMLPVYDKPAIQYTIEEAVKSGIEEILIVTGRGKQAIENHFDRSFELEYFLKERNQISLLKEVERIGQLINIFYVRQKEPLGLGHAILCGKSFIDENEPFAVFLADDLIAGKKPAMAQLTQVYEQYGEPVVAVERMPREKISQYGVIESKLISSRVREVKDLVEKPSPEKAPSNLAIVGRYILTPDIFKILEETHEGRGGEIQLTDALRQLNKRRKIYACEFEGRRYDLGNKLEYTKACIDFALEDQDIRGHLKSYLKEISK